MSIHLAATMTVCDPGVEGYETGKTSLMESGTLSHDNETSACVLTCVGAMID